MTAYHKCTECDNCEEKPAKFLCKTCPGYLCEVCKIEHEKKKISQYHIIAFFTSSNEDTINFLYCSLHEKKILECYCNVCHKPVCTECILQSHNGHSMKLLSIFYKEMREDSLKKKKEIENTIIPHYNQLLTNESEKKVSLSKRTEEIEKEIVHHTNYLVMEVKEISEQMIRNLKTEEKKGLREIDHFIYSIQRKIETIQGINERLSASLEAKPSILFFELIENIDLEDFRTLHFQPAADYTFDNFQPGNITSIQELFGLLPKIKRTGGVYELKSKSNVRFNILKRCISNLIISNFFSYNVICLFIKLVYFEMISLSS